MEKRKHTLRHSHLRMYDRCSALGDAKWSNVHGMLYRMRTNGALPPLVLLSWTTTTTTAATAWLPGKIISVVIDVCNVIHQIG